MSWFKKNKKEEKSYWDEYLDEVTEVSRVSFAKNKGEAKTITLEMLGVGANAKPKYTLVDNKLLKFNPAASRLVFASVNVIMSPVATLNVNDPYTLKKTVIYLTAGKSCPTDGKYVILNYDTLEGKAFNDFSIISPIDAYFLVEKHKNDTNVLVNDFTYDELLATAEEI